MNSISRSTASSQAGACAPGAASSGAAPLHLQEPQDDVDGGLPGVLQRALGLGKLRSVGSAAAYPGAMTTPNCHRLRFF